MKGDAFVGKLLNVPTLDVAKQISFREKELPYVQ